MRFKTMAFVAALGVALPAVAQTADPAAPAPPAAKPKKERKICREDPAMTGSNMVRSVCHTRAEWAALDASGASSTGGISSSRSGRSSSGPDGSSGGR